MAVTTAYGGLAMVLLVVIAAVALVLQPPAPPAVAEFAPQAADTIDEAPPSQSSQFGSGDGGACAMSQRCEGSTTTTTVRSSGGGRDDPAVDRPRVLRCVGTPPRQTEDPQSPPCANYWAGDNGGATWQGVTADEIRVAIPCTACGPNEANAGLARTFADLAEHFNRRYQLYGRRFRVFPMSVATFGDAHEQRAAAEHAAAELKAFAAFDYDVIGELPDVRPYYDELARRRVLSITGETGFRTADELARSHPYEWTYDPPLDEIEANLGRFACRSLVGREAEHAGALLARERRSFAIVRPKGAFPEVEVAPVRDALRGCGAPVRVVEFASPFGSAPIGELAADRVTTIICLCSNADFTAQFNAAQSQGYEPEWLTSGVMGHERGLHTRTYTHEQQSQARRMFGMSASSKFQRPADEPWYWAIHESNPDYRLAETADSSVNFAARVYHQLLVLASGVQFAGPNLTPETFARGLNRITFANPGAGEAPYWQARVGFAGGRHSMVLDYALIWYGPNGRNNGLPGFCYIDRGRRWSLDTWPSGRQPFFDLGQPCR